VELSFVVAPSSYIFTKKGEILIIASCSLCKYDRRESPCKTSRYIVIKNDNNYCCVSDVHHNLIPPGLLERT
jgi:hypothetical protein